MPISKELEHKKALLALNKARLTLDILNGNDTTIIKMVVEYCTTDVEKLENL
jgi:hypothetical protein